MRKNWSKIYNYWMSMNETTREIAQEKLQLNLIKKIVREPESSSLELFAEMSRFENGGI